jgi:uncharacterized integral membrane protein (TIGR00697 family)
LVIANVTAGKLFGFLGASISAGAFAYMACLAVSDMVVDVYGPRVGYRLVMIGSIMNVAALGFGQLAVRLPVASTQEAFQPHFEAVFDASAAVLVASIIGFPITDLFETFVWKKVKTITKSRHLWLRMILVKLPGQLLDASIFYSLAFYVLPQVFYGRSTVSTDGGWDLMSGAWIYGLWKGCLGLVSYPLLRVLIPWIHSHRDPDILGSSELVAEERWNGRW